ncbi:MAG TPA: TMEM175 family protein [Puia sp.]|nr:TMEM175 family protein [Puia sp.]
MHKNRLEAFSDGVLAIIITIMVLEIKTPHGTGWQDLKPMAPILLTYLFSFIYVGIYWNNHHHLFHVVQRVNGKILWANLHLLFWVSLLPFATAWVDENHFASLPVATYGVVLLMCAIAWTILASTIIHFEGEGSKLKRAYQSDNKGKISTLLYIVGIASAFFYPVLSIICYIAVAAIWFIPDSRIERLKE